MSGTLWNSLFNPPQNSATQVSPAPNQLLDRINAQPIGSDRWQQYAGNQSRTFDPLVGFVDQNPILQSDVARLPVNPVSGALTPSGEMLTNSLMGMSGGIRSIPQRIAQYAEGLGYNVVRDSSKLSESEYLSLIHDKLPDQNLKVRISQHDLPSRYGSPGDYDVHVGSPRDFSIDWKQAVRGLASRVGEPVPAPVQAALSRASRSIPDTPKVDPMTTLQGQQDLLKNTYPGEYFKGIYSTNYEDRSTIMQDLLRKYEAENPGKVPWVPYLSQLLKP